MRLNQVLLINDGGETGYVTAQMLIDAGANLLLIDRVKELPETLERQLNAGKFERIHFDFYQTDSIESTLKPVFAEGKIFDSLIYAAGIGGVRPLGMTTPNFVQQLMNANFFAFLECVRVVCKKQRFAAGGSVVAISSVSSIRGLKSKIAYTSSKSALDASIKGLAAELADRKIRVNSIQKGWVRADMQHGFIQDNMALNDNNDLAKQVLGIIESDELASLVNYLISDASKSITGTNILLDGGYTL